MYGYHRQPSDRNKHTPILRHLAPSVESTPTAPTIGPVNPEIAPMFSTGVVPVRNSAPVSGPDSPVKIMSHASVCVVVSTPTVTLAAPKPVLDVGGFAPAPVNVNVSL